MRFYKPLDIAKMGMIKNSKQSDDPNKNYFFILNLIKKGRLKAKDYGNGSRHYWLVSEAEIKRYLAETNN